MGVVDDVLWPQLFTVASWRRGNSAETKRGKWADRLGTIQVDLQFSTFQFYSLPVEHSET
jgi:hypothetical protein